MPYVHRHVAWVLIMAICIHIIGLVQLFNTLTEQKITTKQLQLAHLIVADTFNVLSRRRSMCYRQLDESI